MKTSYANTPNWLPQYDVAALSHATPSWWAEIRKQQWDAFLQHGVPTRKNERWKYTDLSFLDKQKLVLSSQWPAHSLADVIHQHRLQRDESILLVSVNGYFMPALSDLAAFPEQIIVSNLQDALNSHTELIQSHWHAHSNELNAQVYPFASLNVAMATDGLFVYLPEEIVLPKPIHHLSLVMGDQECIANPFHMIILGRNSQLTLIEEHFSFASHFYMKNIVSTIRVGQDAGFEYIKIQNEGNRALHLAHTFIQQQNNSRVSWVNCSLGSAFARDEIQIKLQEQGAQCRTAGFYRLSHDNHYVDNHVDIQHLAPYTDSNMLYKGILDHQSRAVFNGRVYVEKEAQKISAYQANHSLLLSKEAEMYAKPELEIYADDVRCKHGATIGQIDAEALFYLRSRGIKHEDAIDLLLSAFADEVLQRITSVAAKMRVREGL